MGQVDTFDSDSDRQMDKLGYMYINTGTQKNQVEHCYVIDTS